jgi:hypothetical protein
MSNTTRNKKGDIFAEELASLYSELRKLKKEMREHRKAVAGRLSPCRPTIAEMIRMAWGEPRKP